MVTEEMIDLEGDVRNDSYHEEQEESKGIKEIIYTDD